MCVLSIKVPIRKKSENLSNDPRMSFMFPYLTPKSFPFLCTHLLVCPSAFSLRLFEEFTFVILEVLFCLPCLNLSWCHLNLLSFAKIFLFISSSCNFRRICCSYGSFRPNIFFHVSPCCRNFLAYLSNESSNLDFVFLFGFPKEDQFLIHHRLIPL